MSIVAPRPGECEACGQLRELVTMPYGKVCAECRDDENPPTDSLSRAAFVGWKRRRDKEQARADRAARRRETP